MKYTQDDINRIKKEVDFQSHIESVLWIGNNKWKTILFHANTSDKNPSLAFNTVNKLWYDHSALWGENKGGDIITFVQKIEGRKDAIQYLSEKYWFTLSGSNISKEKNNFEWFFHGAKNNNSTELKIYLEWRGINFEKVSSQVVYLDQLSNMVIRGKNLEGNTVALMKRNIKEKWFYREGASKFVFTDKLEKNKPILAVEGDIDYLSIYQSDILREKFNIVGIPGKGNFDQITLWDGNIYCIPDNDDTEKEVRRILSWKAIFLWDFLKKSNTKDINDFLCKNNLEAIEKNIIEEINKRKDFIQSTEVHISIQDKPKDSQYVFIEKQAIYLKKYESNDGYSLVFHNRAKAADVLNVKEDMIRKMRTESIIPTYRECCYWMGGKSWCYNLMDERFVKASKKAEKNDAIAFLISNLCGGREQNIEWLEKALWKKYINPNDHLIPGVIFHGQEWAGKGTFIELLARIFGRSNVLPNVQAKALTDNFDSFLGNKLIIEFAELSTDNTNKDKMIMNRLKNIVNAPTVHINRKHQDTIEIENIAWFFISSNEQKPVHMEDGRRFSVIRTGKKLETEKAEKIYEAINSKEIIANFLAYLKERYSKDILTDTKIIALDNDEKRELQERSHSMIDEFWVEMMEKYGSGGRISPINLALELEIFATENGIRKEDLERYYIDQRPAWIYKKPVKNPETKKTDRWWIFP